MPPFGDSKLRSSAGCPVTVDLYLLLGNLHTVARSNGPLSPYVVVRRFWEVLVSSGGVGGVSGGSMQ